MAINFDSLPQENPFGLPKPGVYLAKIVEAQMKQGKDATKPMYLNLKYELINYDGTKAGTLYDIISESDSSVVMYKIGRFVRACGIPLQGSMELKDLAKIVNGKTIVVDVAIDDKGDRPRAQVDLFTREAYYMKDEFEEIYKLVNPDVMNEGFMNIPDGANEEVPFDATSGADAGASSAEY